MEVIQKKGKINTRLVWKMSSLITLMKTHLVKVTWMSTMEIYL